MTKIKLCGLSRQCEIAAANSLGADYIGFVFYPKSKRFIVPERALELKSSLSPGIKAVGVFVDERPEIVIGLLKSGVIDIAQLHGEEDEDYIKNIKAACGRPVIKAFKIHGESDINAAQISSADYVLLDSGAGTGELFDWDMISGISREYFLAGGLNPGNVGEAVQRLSPFAVDVSSGIEINGIKNEQKMKEFVDEVRRAD